MGDTVRRAALMGRRCHLGVGSYERFQWLFWLYSVTADVVEPPEEEACDMLCAVS